MHLRTLGVLASLVPLALAVFDIDSTPNAVGICYSVWHNLGYNGSPPPDITDILNGDGGAFAGVEAWHFWGRPAGGYYGGGNTSVLDRHFAQISGAGIDFIVIDGSNLQGDGNYAPGLFTEPSDALLAEMVAQRNAGKADSDSYYRPYVAFWVGTASTDADPSAVGNFVHDRYYTNSAYSDLWVTLDGLPLLLTTDVIPWSLASAFTLRKMWGLQSTLANQEWSFLQNAPQNVGMDGSVAEQVSVCTAKQADYMTDTATATSREEGATFQTQWQLAFQVRPKVVMLTWWNEWMAQRQPDGANGQIQFVVAYDGEYSRDIEPQDPNQATGHGSHYLDWTKLYVAAYKANQGVPGGLTGY